MFIAVLIMSMIMNVAPAAKDDAVKPSSITKADANKAVEEEFKDLEDSTDKTEIINVDSDTSPAAVEKPAVAAKPAQTTPETKPKVPEVKPEVVQKEIKPEGKANTKPEAKPEVIPEAKPEVIKAAEIKAPVPKKETSLNKEIMEVTEENGIQSIKKYYIINNKGEKILVRKELDLNGDGKVDYVYYYDNKKPTDERIEKIAVDNDFDGKFDEIKYYNPDNGQLVREELDLNFDGRPEIIKRYYNGQLVKKEIDTNFDGVMDYWEYYQDGKLVRVEIDTNGDGKPDKIGKTEIPEVYKFDINEVDKKKSFDESPKMTGGKVKKGLKGKKTGKLKGKKLKKPKLLKKKRIKKQAKAVTKQQTTTTQETTTETTNQ